MMENARSVDGDCNDRKQLAVDYDTQAKSNPDVLLMMACSGGHDELSQVLLACGADLEHRDKRGGVVWNISLVCQGWK